MVSHRHVSAEMITRQPILEDSARLHDLVRRALLLAENSAYCNLIHCNHFCRYLRCRRGSGEADRFRDRVSLSETAQYLLSLANRCYKNGRGQRLPMRMIQHILARPVCSHATTLEATVSAINAASRAMFESVAKAKGAQFGRYRAYTRPRSSMPIIRWLKIYYVFIRSPRRAIPDRAWLDAASIL